MKRLIFLIFSITLFCTALVFAKPLETELMQAFISPMSEQEKYIAELANLSAKRINIVFEANSLEELENMKSNFPTKSADYYSLIDIYSNYPINFLSDKTREDLSNNNYDKVRERSLEKLYNPIGIYISAPDKDPYLLATDFVLSKQQADETKFLNDKYYSVLHTEVKTNEEIENLMNLTKDKSIYLTGSPIHAYVMSQKSKLEVNLICIISFFVFLAVCRFYFKSWKIFIPISLSILFGFLFGFSFSSLIFKNLHILTFVFSTSLIGISLDYSLHYFCKENEFKKSLTISMITTILAFLTLTISDIELLKQIGIFTSFGLIGVYLFVIVLLPYFPKYEIQKSAKFAIPAKFILPFFAVIILVGIFHVKFDDNLKNIYVPPKNLAKSEELYQKVFMPKTPEFLIIKGKNTEEILQKEEELNLKQAVCLSKFVSSKKRQKENIELVKKLYQNDLKNYEKILDTRFNIKEPKLFEPDNFPLNSDFLLDKNTSFVIPNEHRTGSINVADEISKMLYRYRISALKTFPCVFCLLLIFLSLTYGVKNSFKIIISPLLGIVFTLSLLALCGQSLNIFHILGFFLILGFSLDYSIFRLKGGEKSKNAVFISVFSTAFSFLLLSLTSFKLISSLGITVFLGVLSSYVLSLFMIESNHDKS